MTEPYSCHLLIDPPADGAWNMAVDEALLADVPQGDPAVWLRFYEWQEPTLSLGYFQPFAPWRKHVRGECSVVRRQTGGGAILHDRELTYSLVLPPRDPLIRKPHELYERIHEALIAALAGFGIAAQLWGPAEDGQCSASDEPYLCFERRSEYDVVIRGPTVPASVGPVNRPSSCQQQAGDFKVCGSAQRRRRGALLVHGSLLLGASPVAPQLPGIEEVTGRRLSVDEARAAWQEELAHVLERPLLPSGLPQALTLRAEQIRHERFLADAWTARR